MRVLNPSRTQASVSHFCSQNAFICVRKCDHQIVNVIGRRGLKTETAKHPEAATAIDRFYSVAQIAMERSMTSARLFPPPIRWGMFSFDILGGKYRLITTVDYGAGGSLSERC